MRAAVIDETGCPDVLHLADVRLPLRINSEVLVQIAGAGVNPLDAKTRGGRGVSAAIESFPYILGQDFSGVVVETPYEAFHLKVGDEVYGMLSAPRGQGSYAEYAAVPSMQVCRKPARLSMIEAAAVPVAALTAWGMVVDVAKAHEGQRILIHAGAGGVGHFAVQFAAYFGAHVIATSSGRNSSWLRELGAAEVIDYTSKRFEDEVSRVDVVIDLIGNATDDTGTRSLQTLRPGGLLINAPTGSWPTVVADAKALGLRATTYTVSPDASTLTIITRLINSGDVHVHVDEVFELSDAAEAHRRLEEGHTRGKLVIAVSEQP
ncbi:NADP-dependent oxidoreductase [Subtercola boreus]|uniref:NADPH:quinone reductase n=1 Tax=Subtercola boreus TaxID=120213 RepID=A0A3E0WA67_9MICO|nr:NADP-dependent oxidoreductase [Subtercola boreus]RFA18851.1 NADPH:quinone reductase [Subtercola boreus]RFA18965.1 NADPH:quinone reductase [Subtercola boreus]RFA25503.1 NADPH:quinone reductase [Subtercola boreus]